MMEFLFAAIKAFLTIITLAVSWATYRLLTRHLVAENILDIVQQFNGSLYIIEDVSLIVDGGLIEDSTMDNPYNYKLKVVAGDCILEEREVKNSDILLSSLVIFKNPWRKEINKALKLACKEIEAKEVVDEFNKVKHKEEVQIERNNLYLCKLKAHNDKIE